MALAAESPEFLGRRAAGACGQVAANRPSLAWQLFSPVLLIGTLLISVFFICAQLTNLSVLSWLPIMLEKAGRDPTFAALAITAFNAGGRLACLLVGWLIDKFGAVQVTLALVVGGALSFILIGGQLDRADRLALQLGLFIIGLFSQGAYGAINVVVTEHYPVALRSTGLGWAKGVSRLGAIAGPILLGFALTGGMAPGDILRAFAAPEIVAAGSLVALWLFVPKRKGREI